MTNEEPENPALTLPAKELATNTRRQHSLDDGRRARGHFVELASDDGDGALDLSASARGDRRVDERTHANRLPCKQRDEAEERRDDLYPAKLAARQRRKPPRRPGQAGA